MTCSVDNTGCTLASSIDNVGCTLSGNVDHFCDRFSMEKDL